MKVKMKKIVRLVFSVMVIAAGLFFGCDSKEFGQAKEMLVYCGAGIRPPVAELAETFGRENNVNMVTNYAGSETLLSTIRLVRRGDIYMPGDKHYVEQAADEGMVYSHRSVCYFVPTILVQKGNPKNIHGLDDLLSTGVKLGLGDAKACAIGRKTKKIFTKNNIAWADVEKNLKFQSLTVNELGMQIQTEALDAVIVWDAIARYYEGHGQQVPIPVKENVISTVDIAVLKFTKERELAEKFVEFVASKRGRDIFIKHNYTVEPPS